MNPDTSAPKPIIGEPRSDDPGWLPIGVRWTDTPPQVDWAWFGGERFTEPFFEQTVARILRDPTRRFIRRLTAIQALADFPANETSVPPTGFIFHLSRCGSTLLAQMLAALPQNLVISEAPPLDEMLLGGPPTGGIPREQRVRWFRGMVAALGQRRAHERHYFIKFDSWHTLALPLIHEAFPDVPWVFLYRDPIEVMVSHQRMRGRQTIPETIAPEVFGFEPGALAGMSLDEYGARVLGQIATATVTYASLGRSCFINYTSLPAIVWESLGPFFGIEWTSDDLARLRAASARNSKAPTESHADDRAAKQQAATPELHRLVAEHLAAPYAALEARR